MKYEQLSEESKQRALQHVRDMEQQDWTGEHYLNDINSVLTALGFMVDCREPMYKGQKVRECEFSWSLGYCQGDGFRFRGSWDAADVNCSTLIADRPTDKKLHAIIGGIIALVLRYPFGRCVVGNEHYGGRTLPSCEIWNLEYMSEEDREFMPEDARSDMADIVDQLCTWAYNELREGYEGDMDDEQIQAAIDANEWEFIESGRALA